MQITETVTLRRPREEVWALFQDVPEVASCMPGAELTGQRDDGSYTGKVSIRLGPFTAAFEGEVEHHPDPAAYTGTAVGRGVDKRGGSRSRMTMGYALTEVEGATKLAVDAEVQLSGPGAQFGRPAIVTETARLLIGQFVANVEAKLDGQEAPALQGEISALKLGSQVVGASVKRWLGKDGN